MKKILSVCFVFLVLTNINFVCFAMEADGLFDFSQPDEYVDIFFAKSRSASLTNEELAEAISADGKLCGRNIYGLNLSGCSGITDLSPLARLTMLEELNLSRCIGITDLQPLAELTNIGNLNLSGCTSLTDLSVLSNFESFFILNLSGCTGLESISLNNLKSVTILIMNGCKGVVSELPREIVQLSLCKCRFSRGNLLKFILQRACGHARKFNCLSVITALPNRLSILDFSGSIGLKRLPEIPEMTALEEAYLKDCKDLEIIPDFRKCNFLRVLDLQGTRFVAGIDEDLVAAAADGENNDTENVKLLLDAIQERDEASGYKRDRAGEELNDGQRPAKRVRRV